MNVFFFPHRKTLLYLDTNHFGGTSYTRKKKEEFGLVHKRRLHSEEQNLLGMEKGKMERGKKKDRSALCLSLSAFS